MVRRRRLAPINEQSNTGALTPSLIAWVRVATWVVFLFFGFTLAFKSFLVGLLASSGLALVVVGARFTKDADSKARRWGAERPWNRRTRIEAAIALFILISGLVFLLMQQQWRAGLLCAIMSFAIAIDYLLASAFGHDQSGPVN